MNLRIKFVLLCLTILTIGASSFLSGYWYKTKQAKKEIHDEIVLIYLAEASLEVSVLKALDSGDIESAKRRLKTNLNGNRLSVASVKADEELSKSENVQKMISAVESYPK